MSKLSHARRDALTQSRGLLFFAVLVCAKMVGCAKSLTGHPPTADDVADSGGSPDSMSAHEDSSSGPDSTSGPDSPVGDDSLAALQDGGVTVDTAVDTSTPDEIGTQADTGAPDGEAPDATGAPSDSAGVDAVGNSRDVSSSDATDASLDASDARSDASDAGSDAAPTCASNVLMPTAAVASSNNGAGVVAGNAIDGNFTTRWDSIHLLDPQSIYLDFGARVFINRVQIAWESACAKNYDLQWSNDAVTWTTLTSITGNTNGGPAPIDWTTAANHTALSGVGRYLRVNGTVRCSILNGYSIWEMRVFGDTNSTCHP
jgi:hypothetical protein